MHILESTMYYKYALDFKSTATSLKLHSEFKMQMNIFVFIIIKSMTHRPNVNLSRVRVIV